ncbi:thrombospondin type 3 repeat-containing protein [Patescibacteria group bacterium]|nr:thrombospondin type 3 repeat-containing protein [Patescibacteria group bacterium]MBU4347597.1 thrombospondin type 3 repeat-containing protein [Patescibacteria group bacterium]MBU4455645.1 thrombospondin type 3 repeat-containing protein [Patescibacteria group bacterium]MCG2691165.1 thrombospondin type 3 repeat-containing protein [Candidatus Parcubacteria bacterium]
MNNCKKIITFICLLFICFVFCATFVKAADICDDATVKLIIRNSDKKFIPNISFEIYEQIKDADGNPKYGGKITSGKISSVLGYAIVKFKPTIGKYAIKIWDKNSSVGEFWFFNDINVGCGGSVEVTEYLSGIHLILRDAESNLRKNKEFSLYTQRYDADGKPIKEKKDLVAKFNTLEAGEITAYVADSSHFLSKQGGDYIFSATGINGGEFIYYDINIKDKETTELTYVFSDILFTVKDSKNIAFPSNTKIEIYKQDLDYNGDKIFGDHIKDIYTDDKGASVFEYPEGAYAAKIKGGDGKYQYFWDLEMNDQARNEIELKTGGDYETGEGACENKSKLSLVVKNYNGDYIPGINFELYEQNLDANGLPKEGAKITSGKIDQLGKGEALFNPDPRKAYALKAYDKNSNVGEYWFFDGIKFLCEADKKIEKHLSAINVILRDGDGSLRKNQKFSLYTQKLDFDGNPIKEKKDLVSSSLVTSEKGTAVIYVSGDHPHNKNKKGKYVFAATGNNKADFIEYGIGVSGNQDTEFEYTFSDIVFEVKNAANEPLADANLEIYEQSKDSRGNNVLGKSIVKIKTNKNGEGALEYAAGAYAVKIKDDVGNYFTFWDVNIKNRERVNKKITTGLVKINVKEETGDSLPQGTTISIYSMTKDNDYYYKNKNIKSAKIAANGYLTVSLAPSPYLFVVKSGKSEYGRAIYAEDGKITNATIKIIPDNNIDSLSKFKISPPKTAKSMAERLKGYILLQVESKGEAWYVDENTKSRYYMKDGAAAYQMMRKFGLGITNNNLSKIPIGIDDRFEDCDQDGDGLPDKMEEAIGADTNNSDSDGDGYLDGEEARNGYNPLGKGKMAIDNNLTETVKGKILLQVESRGEAWYLNPKDGKRYYMKDGDSAYQIMRFLSLGITNSDLEKIETKILQ